jgi:PHP family Zn ribbon phosphoesterase
VKNQIQKAPSSLESVFHKNDMLTACYANGESTNPATRAIAVIQRSMKVASGTYFISACPTCGRKLEIRVELLEKMVACKQCGAVHQASESTDNKERDANERRIEQLLARARAYVASTDSVNAATRE